MRPTLRTLLTIVVLAGAAAGASAAQVSGTWDVDGSVAGHPVKFSCALKQSGAEVSGTAHVQEKDQPLTGTVKDQVVTFRFEVQHEGAPLEMVFTATLTSETTMSGSIAVAGAGGDFSAKRR
jgi:hypothetical protein